MSGLFSAIGAGLHTLFAAIASAMHSVLPSWVRLPDLTFSAPHPIYWIGLVAFPIIAMVLVKRAEGQENKERLSTPIAYMLLVCGGFAGLHRFYVRTARVGFVFVALFLLVLYGNNQSGTAREANSEASNTLRDSEFRIEHFQKLVDQGSATAQTRLDDATQAYSAAQQAAAETSLALEQWGAFVGGVALIIAALMLIDLVLLPGLVRACAAREAHIPPPSDFSVMERGPRANPRNTITSPYIRFVENLSLWSGSFVAYWSMIAVFVYYYEVIARYVFNSPTNWAHESMFLMFGMQYLLSGAFALRDDAHVRVDVVYERFSLRNQALIDIITSFFFFVFAITLFATGWLFAMNSIEVWEVSFTEWAIQYWPVKMTISIGAVLLLLQGSAKLIRDVTYYRQMKVT